MCFGGGGDKARESESKNALAQQAANALKSVRRCVCPVRKYVYQ